MEKPALKCILGKFVKVCYAIDKAAHQLLLAICTFVKAYQLRIILGTEQNHLSKVEE